MFTSVLWCEIQTCLLCQIRATEVDPGDVVLDHRITHRGINLSHLHGNVLDDPLAMRFVGDSDSRAEKTSIVREKSLARCRSLYSFRGMNRMHQKIPLQRFKLRVRLRRREELTSLSDLISSIPRRNEYTTQRQHTHICVSETQYPNTIDDPKYLQSHADYDHT